MLSQAGDAVARRFLGGGGEPAGPILAALGRTDGGRGGFEERFRATTNSLSVGSG